MTDSTTLTTCPFCGERAETDFIPEHHSYQIECSDSMGCTARVTRDSKLGVIEAWNRRAPAPASSEPVAAPYDAHAEMLEAAKDLRELVDLHSHAYLCAERAAALLEAAANQKPPVAVPAVSKEGKAYEQNFAQAAIVPDGPDCAQSLANDPRLCCRSHPHEKQSLHCQLREVAAWLRLHSAAGKAPSAENMRAHAEQADAVALELRAAPAGMPEPELFAIDAAPDGFQPHYEIVLDALDDQPDVIGFYTAAQVQAMLSAGLAPGWQAVPVEPTDEMVEAAWDGDGADYVGEHKRIFNLSVAWRDALAAAPRPAAPSGPAREPLTDEQLVGCINRAGFKTWDSRMWALKRQIEAAHGITAAQNGGAQ